MSHLSASAGTTFFAASSYETSELKITSADALVVTSELNCTTSKPSGLDSVQTVSGLASTSAGAVNSTAAASSLKRIGSPITSAVRQCVWLCGYVPLTGGDRSGRRLYCDTFPALAHALAAALHVRPRLRESLSKGGCGDNNLIRISIWAERAAAHGAAARCIR